MDRNVKRGVRIVAAICPSVILLVALLLTLQAMVSSQAAPWHSAAHSVSMNDDIFPASGDYHGAVIPLEQMNAFECMVGKKLQLIKIYQHFHNGDFYEDFARLIHDHGAIEFLSFDPTVETGDLDSCEVLSGRYDSTVITFARHIKRWGQPLILSFAGEMNGNWAGWSGFYNFGPNCVTRTQVTDLFASYGCTDKTRVECADGPERYRNMYRHIHNLFATEGVTNVTWAWVVNHDSIPNEVWNQVDNYYPGDAYVDVISVDGFNWGDDGPGGCPVDAGWRTFGQVFSATLTSLSNTHPTRPFMLGEFASVEGTDPMSKANWITDAYRHIKSDWPQIKAAVWFDLGGDCSFPIESSLESIQAYRKAIADPYFIGDPEWCRYLPQVCKAYPPTSFCKSSGSGGTETIEIDPSRTVREIRIDLIKRRVFSDGKQYGFSLWEVEIYGPGSGNLASGATATASSSQDSPGCYACFPYKAIDGNMNTRWSSDWSEPQWLTITLPTPQVVDRVLLKWEQAYAKEYCVNVTK